MASERDEEIYDGYLDACAEGRVEEPAAYLARHPDAGEQVRSRIEEFFGLIHGRRQQRDVPFERLGEFRLLQPLDEGGMGAIYLAEQESLGRVVALKVVRPELQRSPEIARRFEREAEALARLRHPNIVTVHGAGIDQGVHYLAMELVEGRRLDDLLARESVRPERAATWAAALARGLADAHGHGIVHRDVKPSNIRIDAEDRPLLLDFGIAYDMGAESAPLTRTFTGSPPYATPEQIDPRGSTVDGRTDVYALGVTLYQCLTGIVPFAGDRVERIFHRILHEDPIPPRRLNPSVPRDLEVVTLKAMRKNPADRYATAADFADDLEAFLADRPIRARPPSRLQRAARWCRRRPAAASAFALVVVLAAVFSIQRWSAAAARRDDAARAVTEARARVERYRREREEVARLEEEVHRMAREQHSRYFSPEEDLFFRRQQRAMAEARRSREAGFYDVLDLLRRAERLDPAVAGVAAIRGELYLEKWREARLAHDRDGQAFYRRLVESEDHDGRFARFFATEASLTIVCDPPGAECHLFRYREQAELFPDGEARMVPVPFGGTPPRPPGAWAARVVASSGGITVGDLILEIDGEAITKPLRRVAAGRSALVHHAGTVARRTLATDVEVRTTATPLYLGPDSLLGATPIESRALEPGRYLIVLRQEGFEDLRLPLLLAPDSQRTIEERLLPAGSTPAGFVRIPAFQERPPFWIMERPVTITEYLEFINDAATRRLIDAVEGIVLVPRDATVEGRNGYCPRDAQGRYLLPDGWDPEWPAIGISWHDARAYAGWRSRRDRRRYMLPSENHWNRASGRWELEFKYPWGFVFHPKWACSNWSLPRAHVEPVLRYPVDESPYGVFDMSGCVSEWLESWFDESRNLRWQAGGSWGRNAPVIFQAPGGFGQHPDGATGEGGFRLVFMEEPE